MTYREGPEFPFFCHICGAPPTWRGLLADSTLQHLTPEEDDFDHRDYRYPDFMPHQENLGYDARLLPPRHIRWLDAVRLVTKKIVDTVKFTVTDGPVPLLTPLAAHVNIDDGTFHYPEDGNWLCCNVDGYLVHDTCFQMLERVHQHLQATSGSSPHLDLEQLWDWLERGLDDRNNDVFDWGFGDAFQDASTRWPGKRFDPSWQEWIPVKGSMWTVIDPEGPFNCQPLLHRASTSTQPGYSFTCSVKLVQASVPALQHPEPNVNVLSLLPRELQLSILELLPTSSVLNLFLASPDFRRHMENLPSSFWKSRLSFDVPWCADIILSQLPTAQGSGTANGRVQFDRLLRFLEQFYASPGWEPEGENLEFKGLRNRRRIWMNCGIINGYAASRFGYRMVMLAALAFLTAFIFIVFFANTTAVLLVGEILCGLSWGVFATIGPAYASEVCPTNLRGYLTTYVNLCWAIGQLIAMGVLYGLQDRPDDWGYRIPFGLQWIWPVPLMVICWLAPESPWYLVRKGRLEEAKRSIRRLGGNKTEEQINGQLAMMVHTIKLEAEIEAGTSYLECFKGVDLRRTEICCVAFFGQILSGSSFAYSPTYFFEQAGMNSGKAFQLGVGCTGVALVGVILSWWLITYLGRRTLYVWGMAILCTFLMLIGIINASSDTTSAMWAQAAFCFLWLFVYSMTLGPVTYSIVSEISSVRLRPLTVCLARTAYQVVNVVSQVLEPYFMNPTAWNASGKTGFFWGGTALLVFIWAFFRLPEPKGRTYAELDILFATKVPARKFASTPVDVYVVEPSPSQEGLVRGSATQEQEKQ